MHNKGVRSTVYFKVFTEEERRLFISFEKADKRAKEDAIFQPEHHQSG